MTRRPGRSETRRSHRGNVSIGLLAALLAGFATYNLVWENGIRSWHRAAQYDFDQYYLWGTVVRQGGNPYSVEELTTVNEREHIATTLLPVPYMPSSMYVWAAMATLPRRAAGIAWLIVNYAAFVCLVAVGYARLGGRAIRSNVAGFLLAYSVCAFLIPPRWALSTGQSDLVIWAIAICGMALARHRHVALGMALVAIAPFALKLTALAILPGLVLAGNRRWLVWLVLWMALLGAAQLVLAPAGDLRSLVSELSHRVADPMAHPPNWNFASKMTIAARAFNLPMGGGLRAIGPAVGIVLFGVLILARRRYRLDSASCVFASLAAVFLAASVSSPNQNAWIVAATAWLLARLDTPASGGMPRVARALPWLCGISVLSLMVDLEHFHPAFQQGVLALIFPLGFWGLLGLGAAAVIVSAGDGSAEKAQAGQPE